ncbi:MAG: hypothetical protein H7A21_06155 [Spirochaetales bacterium]|nr:hypothetical protein [Leptospiraceae bacterium]MCP5480994.1 hypothetical protein [Spirochaetales bacterium]MCP5485374.1 hypothetical protein [Spirochaetales bacterium]
MAKKQQQSFLTRALLVPTLITRLENGEYLRPLFAWFFRIIAGGVAVAALYGVFKLLSLMVDNASVGTVLSGLLTILLILVLASIVVGILWIRADEILTMSLGKAYPMLALLSVVVKVFAEFASVSMILFGSVFAVLLLIFTTITINNPVFGVLAVFAPLYLPYIVFGILGGLLLLVAGYSAREFLSLLIRIEINTRKSGAAKSLDA